MRHNYAAKGGKDRECGFTHGCEFPHEDLALNLEAHDEEEDGHEQVIVSGMKVMAERAAAKADGKVCVQKSCAACRRLRIRPDEANA